jgi:hypothetical protein
LIDNQEPDLLPVGFMLAGFALCLVGIFAHDNATTIWLGLAIMVVSAFTERRQGDMAL